MFLMQGDNWLTKELIIIYNYRTNNQNKIAKAYLVTGCWSGMYYFFSLIAYANLFNIMNLGV